MDSPHAIREELRLIDGFFWLNIFVSWLTNGKW